MQRRRKSEKKNALNNTWKRNFHLTVVCPSRFCGLSMCVCVNKYKHNKKLLRKLQSKANKIN